MIAIAAIAPPIAIAPVSPMKSSAGNALNQRKPMHAADECRADVGDVEPVLDPPVRRRAERTKIVTAIAVSVASAMIPVPAASPSTPSVEVHTVRERRR